MSLLARLGAPEEHRRERLDGVRQFAVTDSEKFMRLLRRVAGLPVRANGFGHQRSAEQLNSLVVIQARRVEQLRQVRPHPFGRGGLPSRGDARASGSPAGKGGGRAIVAQAGAAVSGVAAAEL